MNKIRIAIVLFAIVAGPFPSNAKTCKKMKNCEEAVIAWCQGDKRKDGDGDGIPCENVCKNKQKVDAIRQKIGC